MKQIRFSASGYFQPVQADDFKSGKMFVKTCCSTSSFQTQQIEISLINNWILIVIVTDITLTIFALDSSSKSWTIFNVMRFL